MLGLLADPVRWRLMRELARGDKRVRELVAATRHPQNLISYHLRQLRNASLVTARRSSFDRRDTYYTLDLAGCSLALADAAATLHPGLSLLSSAPGRGWEAAPPRVLFVCTGNSSRSPMAEALLRYRAASRVEAASAGTRPRPVNPDAVAVLRDRYRIDISRHQPVHVETVATRRFDYVISVCDKARESCPDFRGHPAHIHWSMPDPAAGESGPRGYQAFERTAAELDSRIQFLLLAMDGAAQ